MKQISLAFAFIFSVQMALAQKPEPIYGFAVVCKSTEYYKQQAALWKKEIDKNKHNATAWYNYYRVNRNILGTDTTDHRSWNEKQKSQADLVAAMGKAIPDSYEYNLCRWMMSGNNPDNPDDKKYLLRAAELSETQGAGDGSKTIHYPDLIVMYETDRNIERRNFYSKKLSQSQIASPGMMNYNYNVLMSLSANAIIITCGDNDTYPLWELQSMGIRTDVTVLNLSLLTIDLYREKIFKELEIENLSTTETKEWQKTYSQEVLIKQICMKSQKHPVYIGLTVDLDKAKSIQDSLYLVGLAYEYSTTNMDNIAAMRQNFEQHYALDYLSQHFYNDISSEIVKSINFNYIVPMMKLYEHYIASGDLQKLAWMKSKLKAVAEYSNEKAAINEFLDKK
jgi:hypothetical protein